MKLPALILTLLILPACGEDQTMDRPGRPPGPPTWSGGVVHPGPGQPPAIAFLRGDQVAFTAEQFANPVAVTQGAGKVSVTYTSSDPEIASVDAEGTVTARRPGRVAITATATNPGGASTSASYAVMVGGEVHAWVGPSDTELEFTTGLDGVELFRSTDPDCDITDIGQCADGQSDVLAADTLYLDTALTLDRPAYYTYVANGMEFQPMSVDAPKVVDPQIVRFHGRLWQLGGFAMGGLTNAVWSSVDGMNWIEETAAAAFPARQWHGIAVFDDKLWVIGGETGGYRNDVWFSADGVTWTEATPAAPFTPRSNPAVFAFHDRLWVFGGWTAAGAVGDVWSSADGVTWTEESSQTAFPAGSGHEVLELGGSLFAIHNDDTLHNPIYTSTDAVTWTLLTDDPAFSARVNFGAAAYDGKLWIVGGYDANQWSSEVWYSEDGITWIQVADSPIPARERPSVVPVDDTLLVIGGVSGATRFQDTWISLDGLSWRSLSTSAGFTARSAHQAAVFDDQLWVFPGFDGTEVQNDIWSSGDGAAWTQRVADAPFPARIGYSVVVFAGKLWLIGGVATDATFYNDVWSSPDGIHWTQVTAAAGFAPRVFSAAVAFGGKLWIVGGLAIGQQFADVWSSVDGVTWVEELGDAPFGPASHGQLQELDGSLYLLSSNNLWRSDDGTDWTLVGGTPFSTSRGPAMVAHDGQLWVLAPDGLDAVYSSADGVSWTEQTAAAEFGQRRNLAGASFADKLWVIAGDQLGSLDSGDAWASTDGATWRRGHRTVVMFSN